MLDKFSLFSAKPSDLGVCDGRLAACPDKPNCVSTQSDDPVHAIEPIRFTGPCDAAWQRLRTVLRELPRTKIVVDQDSYLHAESRSMVLRFVDDLEFWIDRSQNIIHFRSAARFGYSDFGVNRRRAETIRQAFQQ